MFTILHMKENEVSEAAALERRCFSSDAWTEDDFLMGIRSPIDTVWIYRDRDLAIRRKTDSDLVAYCVLRIIGDEAEVLNLCVAPEYRRMGAGDLLLDVMMQKCRENFVSAVYLEVRAKNEAARALYRKHGFQDHGIRASYYEEPSDDAVLMKKSDYCYEEADSCCGSCGG